MDAMGHVLEHSEGKFWISTCYRCGIHFGLPDDFDDCRRKDGGIFYCPNGHPQIYSDSINAENRELKREIERERQKYRLLHATNLAVEVSLRSTRGVVTKQRKKLARVSNGVCPCCNRTFKQLARHMACKHPEYVSGE